MLATTVGRLRLIAIIEGISFLLLLGIAMPLKYIAGYPIATKIMGGVHGGLFVLLVLAIVHTMAAQGWSIKRGALIFVSAVVPVGTFFMDGHIKKWGEEDEANAKEKTSEP